MCGKNKKFPVGIAAFSPAVQVSFSKVFDNLGKKNGDSILSSAGIALSALCLNFRVF